MYAHASMSTREARLQSEQQRNPTALSRSPRSRPLLTPQRKFSPSLNRDPPRRRHSVFASPRLASHALDHSHTLPLMSNRPVTPPSHVARDPLESSASWPESSPLQAVVT